MDIKFFHITGVAVLLLFATAACTTVQPFPVPANNPTVTNVRYNLTAHESQHVAWGGQILAIEVKKETSLVTILTKPLDSNGEPINTDKSEGRFLARFSGFRDPAVFAVGRSLTVAGKIKGSETRNIGNYPYVHPVVEVESYRLWPVQVSRPYDAYDYWWYDPWYPWYPWYYYPSHPIYNPPALKLPPASK